MTDIVALTNVPFASLCQHHLFPFVGTASVGYLPVEGRVVGLSKLARVVDAFPAPAAAREDDRGDSGCRSICSGYPRCGMRDRGRARMRGVQRSQKTRCAGVDPVSAGRVSHEPMRSEFLTLAASDRQ